MSRGTPADSDTDNLPGYVVPLYVPDDAKY